MTPLLSKHRKIEIAYGSVVIAVVVFVLSSLRFFVHYYPIELFHHFQVQYFIASVVILIVLAALRRWRFVIIAIAAVIVSSSAVIPLWFRPHDVDSSTTATQLTSTIRILHANVLSSNADHAKLIDLINREKPDLVMLQEINSHWVKALTPLENDYPYKCIAARDDNFGIAIFSRTPLHATVVQQFGSANFPSITFQIQIDNTFVDVISTHPMPPVSADAMASHNEQLLAVAAFAEGRENPLIVVGDLNTTMWTGPYNNLCEKLNLTNARKGFGILPGWPTSLPGIMRIPIDHCLVSDEVFISDCRLGSEIGSDHLPLIIDFQIRR
ncbi:MAG: endonuclease/exonuclease/phosphatase family protein [Planctomycetes bacterium]|nr:endonuclease/exonuclease/phosphatase family protein [Planctomycetota bacterium]